MRKESIECIYELAKKDKSIVFIGSDLGAGTLDKYQRELPHQFLMEGISEAHIVSMAAGLALTGSKVFIHTIAPFFVRRALEQIILDIGAENLDVCILCSGGGLVYGPLGHSHTMVDDFAILSTTPNLKLFAPSDAREMVHILQSVSKNHGPSYIRMGKGNESTVQRDLSTRLIRSEVKNKNIVITTGIMLQRCIAIQTTLKNFDILHLAQISPLDKESIVHHLRDKENIIVIEEHMRIGGLYSRVLDILNRSELTQRKIESISLGDQYIYQYGKQEQLHEILKIDEESLLHRIKECIK